MKAFVVLCVLMWSGLTRGEQMCTTGTCGCCLIERNLERTEDFFDMVHYMMSKDLNETKDALHEIKDKRSIFTAILSSTQSCSSAVSSATDDPVLYNNVTVNLGSGYDQSSGEFTAPVKGVYTFAVSLYNHGPYKSCAVLQVRGAPVYTLLERKTTDTLDSSSISLNVKLDVGDKVRVVQPTGCYMCAHNNYFNTFTGFLLYATA